VSAPTFVAKRFLQGAAGDLVNADYIVRLFVSGGLLFAEMTSGSNIELETMEPIGTPAQPPVRLVKMASL
jgi:hypothetical protein